MKIERSQSVYVVFNPDTNRTKVGVSENMRQRLSNLIADSGCKLQLIYNTVRILNAEFYESKIHERLKEYNYLGEWFTLDCNKIKEIVISETKNATVDSIVRQYSEGATIPELMGMSGMSRSGIVKHLKLSNEWNKNDTNKSVTIEIKKPNLMKDGITSGYDKRVEQNIYTNNNNEKFVYRIYVNRIFKERFFDTLEQCRRYKNNATTEK